MKNYWIELYIKAFKTGDINTLRNIGRILSFEYKLKRKDIVELR